MPFLRKLTWTMVHEWRSGDWMNEGAWTEEKMLDELESLRQHLKMIPKLAKMTVQQAIKKIMTDEVIEYKDGLAIVMIDFSKFADVISTWKHLRTACKHYVRVWLAQDESYTECEFKRKCDSHDITCKDFESMLRVKTIEELAKEEKVVFT